MSVTRPFTHLAISHWQYINGYPNEEPHIKYFFYLHRDLSELYDQIRWFPGVFASGDNDIKKFTELCQLAIPGFEAIYRSCYCDREDQFAKNVFGIRMTMRIKYILQRLERGLPFWEACAPYAISLDKESCPAKLFDEAAYVAADSEIDEEFVREALGMLVRNKRLEQSEMLQLLASRPAAASRVARYLIEHVLTPPKKGSSSWPQSEDLLSLFLKVLPRIPNDSWPEMAEVFMHDDRALHLLESRKVFQSFVNELAKQPNVDQLTWQSSMAQLKWGGGPTNMAAFIPFMLMQQRDLSCVPEMEKGEQKTHKLTM